MIFFNRSQKSFQASFQSASCLPNERLSQRPSSVHCGSLWWVWFCFWKEDLILHLFGRADLWQLTEWNPSHCSNGYNYTKKRAVRLNYPWYSPWVMTENQKVKWHQELTDFWHESSFEKKKLELSFYGQVQYCTRWTSKIGSTKGLCVNTCVFKSYLRQRFCLESTGQINYFQQWRLFEALSLRRSCVSKTSCWVVHSFTQVTMEGNAKAISCFPHVVSQLEEFQLFSPNRFVSEFLFLQWGLDFLSGPNSDLSRQERAQLADEKVKGAGPLPNAITESHPSSSHPHKQQWARMHLPKTA